MAYNAYIEQLPRGKTAFLVKFQGLKFLSEKIRIIAKLESNFVNKVKKRDN